MDEYYDKEVETAPREVIEKIQFTKLKLLLDKVYRSNPFYIKKFKTYGVKPEDIKNLNDIVKLPFTSKIEFQEDQERNPVFGTNLTEPFENYTRYLQTTGTTGKPLKWLDTEESWDWNAKCAAMCLWAAGVRASDIVFFPFGFGPHAAYWGLYQGALKIGSLVIPGGGWDTIQRLECIMENRVTVICCTPTYALRLAEVAHERNINLRESSVRIIVDGGEPGALIPIIRKKIEDIWNARFFDYIGLTEVRAHSFQCVMQESSVHIIESEFIPEVINPETGSHVKEGETGEFVITNLGRSCSPAIRYRTGDIVRFKKGICPCGRTFRMLDGGILGRKDDMIIIRGLNVFPSMVGNIIQKYLTVGDEYRIVAYTKGSLNELKILLDLSEESRINRERIEREIALDIRSSLELRVEVETVSPNTLEKSDYKSRRFIDKRDVR